MIEKIGETFEHIVIFALNSLLWGWVIGWALVFHWLIG